MEKILPNISDTSMVKIEEGTKSVEAKSPLTPDEFRITVVKQETAIATNL